MNVEVRVGIVVVIVAIILIAVVVVIILKHHACNVNSSCSSCVDASNNSCVVFSDIVVLRIHSHEDKTDRYRGRGI